MLAAYPPSAVVSAKERSLQDRLARARHGRGRGPDRSRGEHTRAGLPEWAGAAALRPMAQPFEEMMSTADLIGAEVQQSAAAAVIQGRYRQRPGYGSQHPAPREGSFNLRKAPAECSLIEGMILDKQSNNAASVIQGKYRQRPGHGSQRPAAPPRQGFSLRKGASPPKPQSLPLSSASGATNKEVAPPSGACAAHPDRPRQPSRAAQIRAELGGALSESDAACFIQRFVRRRKGSRQQREKWFQLIELRKHFIDAEVVNPGEYYTDENLMARDALKSDPAVQAAIATAWQACSQGNVLLSKEGYFTMMRKLYLSLTLDDGMQPDSYEALGLGVGLEVGVGVGVRVRVRVGVG
jgi:hypothetical protein